MQVVESAERSRQVDPGGIQSERRIDDVVTRPRQSVNRIRHFQIADSCQDSEPLASQLQLAGRRLQPGLGDRNLVPRRSQCDERLPNFYAHLIDHRLLIR